MADSTDTNAGLTKDTAITPPGGSSGGLNGGFRPQGRIPGRGDNPLVHVEPPKREDLQPSYAQTLTGESDQGTHGWYGSMSKSSWLCANVPSDWK
jgi:erythrocyte band 7 integral membrane protein